ncbi:hypothetical protein CYMTET_46592 [Cymbomonas tetramitiformis]|uniref:Uncharacterized protein n=1 Tax=Cymbomonas tetramitiformis TaxID=36881 RepID=A0AAE0EXF9_9CHLO|nr:hypothetical protein CYMTET_46592 [Cymbomonas tetramitiformis]
MSATVIPEQPRLASTYAELVNKFGVAAKRAAAKLTGKKTSDEKVQEHSDEYKKLEQIITAEGDEDYKKYWNQSKTKLKVADEHYHANRSVCAKNKKLNTCNIYAKTFHDWIYDYMEHFAFTLLAQEKFIQKFGCLVDRESGKNSLLCSMLWKTYALKLEQCKNPPKVASLAKSVDAEDMEQA